MKKAVAILLTIAILCVMGGWSNPQRNEAEGGFSLIDYLETHKVESYEEFEAIISSVNPDQVEMIDPELVSDFSITIDYDNQIVSVLTIEESRSITSGVTDTASKSYYNNLGLKIFTISLTATFHYTTGSSSTASASGSFTPASMSTWTSTPTISMGNFTTTVAYARISGTATSGSSSLSYSLTMTCDDTGHLNSY